MTFNQEKSFDKLRDANSKKKAQSFSSCDQIGTQGWSTQTLIRAKSEGMGV